MKASLVDILLDFVPIGEHPLIDDATNDLRNRLIELKLKVVRLKHIDGLDLKRQRAIRRMRRQMYDSIKSVLDCIMGTMLPLCESTVLFLCL